MSHLNYANPFEALRAGGVFTVLDQFSVIDVSGVDAIAFLHSQFTHDIQHLDDTHARLTGLCSQQGRLLATFLVWRNAQGIQLMLSADIQAAVQKRLSMFILRSKVSFNEASPRTALVGMVGNVESTLLTLFPALPNTMHGKVESDAGTLVRLAQLPNMFSTRADASIVTTVSTHGRYLWIAPQTIFQSHLDWLQAKLTRVDPVLWDWLDIQAGEPRITAATQGQFVPQMVNFEIIGGVSFRKGCYPGQEVVARLQHRGVIRRRTFLAHTHTRQARAGMEVFHSNDLTQACGTLVNAAPAPDGETDCLVQLKLAALESGTLHLDTPDGPLLQILPLPYALP